MASRFDPLGVFPSAAQGGTGSALPFTQMSGPAQPVSLGTVRDPTVPPSGIPIPQDAAPVSAPRGMFGRGPDVSARPSLKDRIGDFGTFLLASAGNPAGLQMLQNQQDQTRQATELQRQLALASFNAANREPTTIQRNDYFTSIGRPDLANTYLNASANPQTLMTDPTTGSVGFYPKGGFQTFGAGAGAQPAQWAQPARQPTPAAISRLRANPHEASQFDEIFGPGASAGILGGQ